MNAQTRLGAFVLIAMITLAVFSSKIGGFQWVKQEGHNINVIFSDASGISVQTAVLMAGVQVGAVETISLQDNQALVTLRIEPEITLPASTRASIAGGGLVGEKYIALRATPGDKTPLAKPVIPSSSGGDFGDMMSRAAALTEDAQRFFSKAEQITETVGKVVEENRSDIRTATHGMASIIEENRPEIHNTTSGLASMIEENRPNIRKTTRGLASMISDNHKQLDRLMQTLPSAAEASRDFFAEGAAAMHDLRELIVDNRENLYRTLFELRRASENLEEFSDDIRRNPWKLMKKKPEVKADRRARQEKMEEMLMTTGRMGIAPARK